MGLFKVLRKSLKQAGKLGQRVAPVVLAAVGQSIAGPAGAVIGGSIGGALQRSKGRSLGEKMKRGARIGWVTGTTLGGVNGAMNGGGFKGFGSGMMRGSGLDSVGKLMNGSSMGDSGLFRGGYGGIGGPSPAAAASKMMPHIGNTLSPARSAAFNGLENVGSLNQAESPGILGTLGNLGNSVFGGLGKFGGGGMGTGLLMSASLAGKFLGKEKNPQATEEQRMLQEMEKFNRGPSYGNRPYRRPKGLRRIPSEHHHQLTEEDINAGKGFTPHEYFEEANPETEYYASGGYVRGNSSGQADDVRTSIPPGAFVMNGMDVSLLGDGNSDRGAHLLQHTQEEAERAGFHRNTSGKNVNVRLSDGEFVLNPGTVDYLGGPKKVSKLRSNLRKHKGVSKILLPKTKSLSEYLR